MWSGTATHPLNDASAPTGVARLLRPKGHLGPGALAALLTLTGLAAVLLLARVLATPGMPDAGGPVVDALRGLGLAANRQLTLQGVPPADRAHVLYVALLPTAALLITIARLTFGLRVLGLRSILLAVGIQEIGLLPSLVLLAVLVAVVAGLRPAMRRIRLPLYARLSLILGITAVAMVGALFVGPWLRSELVWSLAFFPVIILAMLAESIAGMMEDRHPGLAAWRAGWTIALALLISWIGQWPPVQALLLFAPEVMVLNLVAVVLVSEFLDLRLLQHWPARQHARPVAPAPRGRVAVVRSRGTRGMLRRRAPGSPANAPASVQHLVDALRDAGYEVRVLDGDGTLARELERWHDEAPAARPQPLVVNLAGGLQGHDPSVQVPAMLELAGLDYTGPDPAGHACLARRSLLGPLLQAAGVPWADRAPGPGVEVRAGVLGNGDDLLVLPLLQLDADGSRHCPAPLEPATAARVCDTARRAYAAARCRDYARVDLHLRPDGVVHVLRLEVTGILARRGTFVMAAEAAGWTLAELMHRIVGVTRARAAHGEAEGAAKVTP